MLKSFAKCAAAFLIALTTMIQLSAAQTELFVDHPMLKAARNGDYKAVRSQLLQNVDANLTGSRNTTAIVIAAQRGLPDIVELMLEFGAFVNHHDNLGNSSLFYAVDRQDYESVEILLNNNADPNLQNRQGESPVLWAARLGDMEIFEMLIEAGGDPAQKDFTGRNIYDYARNSRNTRMEQDLRDLGY